MKKLPAKAFVLAAGFGNRLRPLTATLPKPLLPLWGRPLLDRVIEMLRTAGVSEIVVNAHWQADRLKEHLDATDYGVRLHFAPEDEIRGTGGALPPWRDFFALEPFWVVNADIAASIDLKEIASVYDSLPQLLGACWVTAVSGPRTVELDRSGRITSYRSPSPGVEGTYTFCGLQLLSPRIFDFIPQQGFSTLVDAYQNAMCSNLFLKGVTVPGSYWNDAGTIERYRKIHMETKRRFLSDAPGAELYDITCDRLSDKRRTFFCISNRLQIDESVRGIDSVVFGNTVLGSDANLKNSVVQGGEVGGRIECACCVPGSLIGENSVIKAAAALGWQPEICAFDFIGQRGSNRRFWRGFYGKDRAVFIVDDGGRAENQRYADHTRLLAAAGVPVPQLLHRSEDKNTVVLEDAGTMSLADKLAATPGKVREIYSELLVKVAVFHRNATAAVLKSDAELEPSFDLALYQWEHALFAKHLLCDRLGYEKLPEKVECELRDIAVELCGGSRCVIHRDLQSSNILFDRRRCRFIDYQGMRFGSPAYDVAALLYDPYVRVDAALRCRLAAQYAALMPEYADFIALFFKGAVQRLVQCLGAFGRLTGAGHRKFAVHILPALENLLEAADAADLNAVGELAEELIVREQLRLAADKQEMA